MKEKEERYGSKDEHKWDLQEEKRMKWREREER